MTTIRKVLIEPDYSQPPLPDGAHPHVATASLTTPRGEFTFRTSDQALLAPLLAAAVTFVKESGWNL